MSCHCRGIRMRFSRGINLREWFGATLILTAAHFVIIFLINAITLKAQIVSPSNAARPGARMP
jgi:hypothetical protein